MLRLVHWLAVNRRLATSCDDLWPLCQSANESLFAEFQIVVLDQPSFFLPAGEVIFRVAKNPSQIPDNPPKGVRLRHGEALERFPLAMHFFLEPIFTPTPQLELYTGRAVREDATWDRRDAIFAARLYGPILRSVQLSWDTGRHCADLARNLGVHSWNAVTKTLVRRNAAQRFGQLARARPAHRRVAADEELWQQEKLRLRLRQEMAAWKKIDPILCFSLPDAPDELHFTAHWYHGTNGKTYMHV